MRIIDAVVSGLPYVIFNVFIMFLFLSFDELAPSLLEGAPSICLMTGAPLLILMTTLS